MDRSGFGDYTGVESGELETQKIHKNRRNWGHITFQYLWHSGVILLVIGTLTGLCLLAAQYEVSMAAVGKVGNVSNITNKSVVSKNPKKGPNLFILPVRPVQGTGIIDLSKLEVESPGSNDDKILDR